MSDALKQIMRAYIRACDEGTALPHLASTLRWDGPVPVPPSQNAQEIEEHWLKPLRNAIPDFERQTHIFLSGTSSGRIDGAPDGREWVAATGYLIGQPKAAFYGIPASDKPVRLRWAEFLRIENGEISEIQMQIDLMDWLEQIRLAVMPPYEGASHVWPAPTGLDGILSGEADPATTKQTLDLGRELLFGGLNSFDTKNLTSMGMAHYFHPNLKWYGPGGVGACLSLKEFEDFHQRAWLESFPDRRVQDLALFAEGPLLAASGTAAVTATFGGKSYRSSPPGAGQPLEFSGLDFWRREGDVFTENWVFVDFVHLYRQMGVDLMDRIGQL